MNDITMPCLPHLAKKAQSTAIPAARKVASKADRSTRLMSGPVTNKTRKAFNPNQENRVINVYALSTPNSVRVPFALEELGVDNVLNAINLRKDEQKHADYLAMNPNGKVPVIVDPDGDKLFTLTESGGDPRLFRRKTGRLVPADAFGRARVIEQMFFHLSGVGPAPGQLGFFKRQATEQIFYAIARFQTEAERVLKVLDGTLSRSAFAAGDAFTIADIALFGWLWRREFAGNDFEGTPNIARWYETVAARLAVARAIKRVTALVRPA
ncbi:glutathione S-transferase family protein [Paraburkholderia panacisoli]|uniref:glutathione S-transferase family protein n=1 Tax=Paraburkholderia panacisoli TaxID=2603818 RepID=UPI001FEA6D65|nr:glutathione S-transferase family protein [Paraburkholderia panacisoli]